MYEIVITKSQGGRNQVSTFSNRYLYNGNVSLEGEDVRDCLLNLVTAEQPLYPDDTDFVRGIIREVDNNVVPIRGRTRSVPLEAQGTFEIPVDDKLAPAHICAVVERQAVLGRAGVGYYRHCVTVSEYEAWLQDRTVPARFSATNVTIGGVTNTVWNAMLNAVGLASLTPVLPDAWGDTFDTPRPIVSVQFGGFRINSPTRPKKSKRAQLAEGFQGEINELGRVARQAYKEWSDGVISPGDVAQVAALAQQALIVYYTAPVLLQGALKWPKIFRALPPTTRPTGVASLPWGG